jgi:hypothetical protein
MARRTRLVSLAGLGLALASAALAQAPRPATPETWGTATGYTTILGYQFQGARPESYSLNNGASQGSYCSGGVTAECLGYAQIDAPDGALLTGFDLWGYDASTDADFHYALIATCDLQDTPVYLVLDQQDLSQQGGDFHYALTYTPGFQVDNAQCGYSIRLKFTDGGEPPQDDAIRVRRVRLSWVRQVSPGPDTATFGDVPIDHPFFQYIEALAKSGITGGCNASPPLFCPNAPLTRGQMAVFLAKALGLQWP